MNRPNFDAKGEALIAAFRKEGKRPRLLLHSCCAPCSSAVTERLAPDFSLSLFFYNPNISSKEEYQKRLDELRRFVKEYPFSSPIPVLEGEYLPSRFIDAVKGLEKEPERGKRCEVCFRLRLEEAAKQAKEENFDFFTTTLSVSPHKDAVLLNRIGEEMGEKYKVPFFPSDFKKKNGYLRSCTLSKEYRLYRQSYCGCIFSKLQAQKEGRL